MAEQITNITDAPEELVTEIEAEWLDGIDVFVSEAMERLPVTRTVLLQVLQTVVKRLLKAEAPKADLSSEDAIEQSIRRETAVKDAASAAYDVIEERFDGSVAEHEYLVTEVLMLVARKAGMATQHRLQAEDLSKLAKKFA